jgi:uncharacterized protein YceK
MAVMASRIVAVMLALVLSGCATVRDAPVPTGCVGDPATIVRALAQAPGAVTLPDGTHLSTCVRRARADGDLQALGLSLISVADTLRARAAADPGAAAGLGYLAGAVRAGVAVNQGLATELGRRIERATALADDAPQAARTARARGLLAGESSG